MAEREGSMGGGLTRVEEGEGIGSVMGGKLNFVT